MRSIVGFLLLIAATFSSASASESDHKYRADEAVTLWVNKVGPYNNPQETYNYYSLPFCKLSENPPHRWGGLGEVLGGNELIDSQIEIKFLSNVAYSFIYFSSICTLCIVINWYILARIGIVWIMIDAFGKL